MMDLVIGALYRFRGLIGPPDPLTGEQRWRFPPADYQLLAVALDYRTQQEKVVYLGVGPPDDGKYFIAVLSDWHRDFTRTVDPPPPKKLAGGYESKSGI
jgi:hypothetical protein